MDRDTSLTCMDCGTEFPFTVKDYQWFLQHQEYTTPTRCRPCRIKRKEERERLAREAELEGREIDSPEPPPAPIATAKTERARTEVICSGCGEKTTVPFVPRGNKPVYCIACFKKGNQDAQKKT